MRRRQENNNHGRDTKTVNKTDDDNENVNKCTIEQKTHLSKRKTRRKQKKKKTRGEKKEEGEAFQQTQREIQEFCNKPHYVYVYVYV